MGEALGFRERQFCWSHLILLLTLIAGPTSSCLGSCVTQEHTGSHSTAFFLDGVAEGTKATL